MELVPAFPPGGDKARALEHLEMLRDGLPGGAEAVFHRQSAAYLEQRLPVSLDELIEDRPPRRIGECLEQVTHRPMTIGKQELACQRSRAIRHRRRDQSSTRMNTTAAPPMSRTSATMIAGRVPSGRGSSADSALAAWR